MPTGMKGFQFILTNGTEVLVQPGYMPSLAAGVAAANPTKFLLQARLYGA